MAYLSSLSVAEIFNEYYASIANYKSEYDGLDSLDVYGAVEKHSNHPSIILINENAMNTVTFDFEPITEDTLWKYINKIKSNKATGPDGMNAKFIKMTGPYLAQHVCGIFNECVSKSHFPTDMKLADITPVFKKRDFLSKENYRSVNVLSVMSKVFERIIADQLMYFFTNILNSSISAYRKGYSSQHVILNLTEYWRKALDAGEYVGTIAMDLSKAFDCMPHALLVAKLYSYGLSISACNFIISYLRDRKQRVKIRESKSSWSIINRGVPQGSVLGPLLFNIFLNDLFFVKVDSTYINYADDNHVCNRNKSLSSLVKNLENDSNEAVEWFTSNYMESNSEKFQGIVLNKSGHVPVTFSIQNHPIESLNTIKVLGVTIDDKLKFDQHISILCRRASSQINALKRISKHLNKHSRMLIYKSFIYSNFNYCPLTWLFCGKKNTVKLEKLQERALRFVFNDHQSSYEALLSRGNFLSLAMHRLKLLAIEVYKCVHKLNPEYMNNLFQLRNIEYKLRDPSRLEQPTFQSIKYGYKSFSYYGSKLWNKLPVEIKNVDSLGEFKCKVILWCHTSQARTLEIF